jgi:CRISPR-associated endonuclease/helicase Cas3
VKELDVTAFSWWLAGLNVMADWIGSNEDWFVYAPDCKDLVAYWPCAKRQAERAVAEAGVLPISPRLGMGIADLLPAGAEPSPMQILASTLDLGDNNAPALILIEDQTGSGKTEAALLLAHRLMTEKSARGLFIALPTMATANALYGRLEEQYKKLFVLQKPAPSLVLAHGKRMLSERFLESLRGGRQEDISTNAHDADETATAQCAGWIAGDRRRTFLADCGVGTIDQALHAVLPTRHAPLRLFGLRDRVLIIDEAHAYDTYMQQELFRLIGFQTRLGGSMIILSATLPFKKRQELVRAFGADALCRRNDYPLVTVVTRDGLTETQCAPNEKLKRNITVTRLPDVDAAIQIICAAAKDAAIGWIRNTVDEAIAAQTLLAEHGIEATLFHARFAMGDRQLIEERVQNQFGKSSVAERRAHVIVGTQVMEQSLDIDFDMLISDLAPVDLLLQRAGRLWRHQRKARPVTKPQFFVISPEPLADPPKDWLKNMRGTEAVYQHPALLWRSAKAIFGKPILALPADVRGLVEAAYDENAPTPQHLQEKSDEADGKDKSAASIAWMNLMEWEKGYMLSNGEWLSDVKTPTRLSEPSQTFRLAVMGDTGLRPWYYHEDLNRAWALSEISAPWRKMQDVVTSPAVSALKQSWSRFDQDIPVLVLQQTAGVWHGEALGKDNRKVAVMYSAERGLEYISAN